MNLPSSPPLPNGVVRRKRTKLCTIFFPNEVTAVTQGISEVERQLRVDEDRLDNLENLKKVCLKTMVHIGT